MSFPSLVSLDIPSSINEHPTAFVGAAPTRREMIPAGLCRNS